MKLLNRKIFHNFKSHRVQVLSNNLVDKDVQSLLLPWNLLKSMQFCPLYSMKDNFIVSNSRLSKCISCCGTIFIISYLLHSIYIGFIEVMTYKLGPMICSFFVVNIAITIAACLINLIQIFNASENVSFVLKYQDVHRKLNDEIKFKRFIIGNWIALISLSVIGLSANILFCTLIGASIHEIFSGIIVLSFDANILYAIRFIQLLESKVDLWNIQVLQYQNMQDMDREGHCKRMIETYVNILDCYDNYRVFFQLMVSNHHILLLFSYGLIFYFIRKCL